MVPLRPLSGRIISCVSEPVYRKVQFFCIFIFECQYTSTGTSCSTPDHFLFHFRTCLLCSVAILHRSQHGFRSFVQYALSHSIGLIMQCHVPGYPSRFAYFCDDITGSLPLSVLPSVPPSVDNCRRNRL